MAQYGVFRMKKFKRSAVHGVGLERNRTADSNRNFARSEIDRSLTDCNVVMHGKACEDFNAEISRQIKKAGVKEKPDSIAMIGLLFTASADYFTRNPAFVELSKEDEAAIKAGELKDTRTIEQRQRYLYDDKMQQYFEHCYRFAVKDVFQGREDLIFSAKIDLDERTPHLHICGVPIIEKTNKKGISKQHLSAKDIFGNRTDLRARQDRFFEQVCQSRGFERGELVDWDAPYEERKHHEETYAHNMAQRKAQEASQQAQIEQNDAELRRQENELVRGRMQLQQQAKAAQALADSRIKKPGLFSKKEECPYKMSVEDYQKATGQTAAINRLLNSPIYTPKERLDMQCAADASMQAKKAYDSKAAELEQIIEQRVKERLALLNRTEPRKIAELQHQLAQSRRDLDYVCDMVKMFMHDNGFSIKDFEQCYGVSLTDDHNQDLENRLL